MAGSSWSLELLRDPMLQAAWATLLAIVFAIAAAHKLRDRDGFLRQLAAYQLLPQPVLLGVVIGLLALECMTVAGVTWGATRPLGMALAALLLTLYASAMAINLGRGRRDIDCGCGGHAQRLDWLLVGRNGANAVGGKSGRRTAIIWRRRSGQHIIVLRVAHLSSLQKVAAGA